MKLLITGGNGFIASYTIEEAKKRGYDVVTNVRSSNISHPDVLKGCEIYNIDIRDQAGIRSLVEKVDGVIHLAAILGTRHIDNAKNFYEVNLFGTINILEACKELNVPMVQITVGNHFEHNNYSNSKVAAEREVLKYAKFCGVKANIVRALNAIGGRQKVLNTGKIMSTFITKALKNEPIEVYGGMCNCSTMDMVYVGDVAFVLLDVMERTFQGESGQIYEAGTGKGYSVWEIAEIVVKLAKSKSDIKEVPMRKGETKQSVVVSKNPYQMEYKDLYSIIDETIKYYA